MEGAEPTSYVLPRTEPSDIPWLQIPSANAALTQAGGRLTVQPQASGEIVIAFDTRGYRNAALLTLLGWIVVLAVLLVLSRFHLTAVRS